MMDNKIELKGFNTLKRLVGNQYGQEVYKTQIESSMKKDCKNVIIFPQQIIKKFQDVIFMGDD